LNFTNITKAFQFNDLRGESLLTRIKGKLQYLVLLQSVCCIIVVWFFR